MDPRFRRASLSSTEVKSIYQDEVKLKAVDHCWDFQLFIHGSANSIFKRLEIDFKYDLMKIIPPHQLEFCDTCVTLDPREQKFLTAKIPFNTGCGGERCVSDLQLAGTLLNIRQPYVLGSTKTIVIQYEITNAGESAYFTQLNVTIPTNLTQFSRVPPHCQQENNNQAMICDINSGKPIKIGEKVLMDLTIDSTKLDGDSFQINAMVSSAGDEKKPEDNQYINTILLTEFSDIELDG